MQGQRGIVADGILKGIARHIASGIFFRTKSPEGVFICFVDGRAGEAKQERIGQGGPHGAPEVAFLRAVRFVYQHDDVVAGIHVRFGIAELMDHGDDDLAGIALEQGLQHADAVGGFYIGNVGCIEDAADLRVQVGSVHQHNDGGAS